MLPTIVMLAALGGPVQTLDDAVRTAEAQQPQIRQAIANGQAADARIEEGQAPLLPQVTGTARYSRATSNFAPQPGSSPRGAAVGGNSFATTNSFNFGVTATQLLYDFGQSTGRWRAAKALAEASHQSEEALRLQIDANTRLAFFAALAQKELVKVAERTVANQKLHLEQTQGFVEAQTHPSIDLAQARLDMANAQLQLINARSNYSTAKAQLNQAMGVARDTGYEVADETLPAVPGEDSPTEALMNEAMARADIVALQKQIRAQELQVSAARGAYGPTLTASTSLTDAGEQLNNMAWNWNGMILLNWPIFQGGVTNGQVSEAQASLIALQAQLEGQRQQVRLAVEQARLAIQAAKASLEVAGVAVTNANERLSLAEGRYAAGVGNMIELGDAQLAATSAAAQKVQADFALATARAQLIQALGRK